MSSGLPSSVPLPTPFPNSSTHPLPFFNPLFNSTPFAAQLVLAHQQRLKLKRSRQRVDAGEPRNTYPRSLRDSSPINNSFQMEQLSSLFPWMNGKVNNDSEKDPEDEIDTEKSDFPAIDLCLSNNMKDESPEVEDSTKVDVENTSSEKIDDSVMERAGSGSSNHSSSSRRKCAQPQKNPITKEEGQEKDWERFELENENTDDPNDSLDGESGEGEKIDEKRGAETVSALQHHLNAPNKLTEMIEAQRRFCAMMENQKKLLASQSTPTEEKSVKLQNDVSKLAQSLKQELSDSLTVSIDKVISDWAAAMLQRMQAEAQAQQQAAQVQAQQQQPRNLLFPPNLFPPFGHPSAALGNPFAVPPGGIFPSTFPGFNPLAALNPGFRRGNNFDDDTPKRKRNKVTDSVRRIDHSSPSSARGSPQLSCTPSYFPPTMVGGHSLYGEDRGESPANSDDFSDCGFEGGAQSNMLSPMHLRKAKLMFFYTRYPNSTLLKTFFPDIRFNKNNTAQLVKWFSNFREFFYIQMEKYARNALSEGTTHREEIVVTKESDLFKQLNQHYNRNNHIQPPDRLVLVVQETLREFFSAIQLGKDVEPSWKKTIYKVIQPLDDPIPEYFKDPNFLERLE
ncbi:unnamed protein product, partial [Mesorhabditis belari]|uniref:Prospero domain-containing protein n=1 Tax=Mesorhabditis belari TaxID=2138241 RepID=A0AAF3E9Y4_9BILA